MALTPAPARALVVSLFQPAQAALAAVQSVAAGFAPGARRASRRGRIRLLRRCLLEVAPALLVLGMAAMHVQAQSAHFSGVVSTLGSGFSTPFGVAVDGAGNVYVADIGNNAVKKIPYSGGSYGTPVTLGSGFNHLTGVTVDGTGNVYVADDHNNAVKEIPYSGGSYGTPVPLGSGFKGPQGVAVDGAGNVYVADTYNYAVKKIPYSGGSYGTPVTLGSGFTNPTGVAVDGAGNVYVADYGNGSVYKIVYSGGSYGAPVTLGSGFNQPYGVAVDGADNVYVADTNNNAVKEIPYSGGSYGTPVTLGSGFSYPTGVAVDGAGNVYVADQINNAVKEIMLAAPNFGPVAVGTTTPPTLTFNFTFDAGVTLGSNLVLTQGAKNLDFTDAGTGSCTSGTAYTTGETCTVVVQFLPQRPGQRLGAVELLNSSGTVLATAYINGIGTGPLAVLAPGEITTVAGTAQSSGYSGDGGAATSATLNNPYGAATDGAGNLYIVDSSNNVVRKIDTTGTITTVAGNGSPGFAGDGGSATKAELNFPTSAAVDGAGDLYIADFHNHSVRRVDAVTGTISTVAGNPNNYSLLGDGGPATSAYLQPTAIAVDGAGDLYIADDAHFTVRRVDATTGIITTIAGGGTAPGDGGAATGAKLSYPSAVALDAGGNLYITDESANKIRMVNPQGIISTVAGNGTAGFSADGSVAATSSIYTPDGVAVDAAGNVYFGEFRSQTVRMVSAATGQLVTVAGSQVVGFSGDGGPATAATLDAPASVTLDGAGNLYISDKGNSVYRKVSTLAAPLSFGSEPDGSTTAAQTITLENIGNAALSAVSPGLGIVGHFAQVAGSGTPADCTASFSLAAGASCNLSLEFQPQSGDIGSVTGSETLTDNSNNASPSTTQTIGLTGTAAAAGDATTTTVVGSPASIGIGQATTITATVKDTTNTATIPTGSVTFTDQLGSTTVSLNGGTPVNLVNGVATLRNVTLAGAGIHTITATYGAVAGSFQGSSGTGSATVETAASFTITVPATAIAGTSFPLTVTALNPDGTVATGYTGTVGFTSTDTKATLPAASGLTAGVGTFTATLATLGSQTITVTDPNAGAPQATVTRLGGGPTPSYAVAGGVSATSSTINVVANGQFPNVNLGATSALPVYFHLAAGTTVGPISVVTQGATGLDFTSGTQGTGACKAQTYSADTVCTVTVSFAPKQPGLRMGAVLLADGIGNPVSTVYVSGTGVGSLAGFTPGTITTVAGNGTAGYSGDTGAATSAELNNPFGVAVDGAGNVYVVDTNNNRIRKVTAATGIITTVAGNGTAGYSGDTGAATSAELNSPVGVAVDGAGNLYIGDYQNSRIRKVTAATGVITTVAGNGTAGYSGDTGAATSAELNLPDNVAVDGAGNLYIADQFNNRIRKVAAATGIITTVAGNGTAGYSGDTGAATSAELNLPHDVAVDGAGNLYIADQNNNRIRKVTAATGIITTVAGNGTSGYSGDNGAATSAELSAPFDLALDAAGNLYIADFSNNRIRKVAAATGIITTVAGNGTAGYGGDTGAATSAGLHSPAGVAVDGAGNVYVSDAGNNRIRKVAQTPPSLSFASTNDGSTSAAQSVTLANIGNATLTAVSPGLAVSSNYAQVPGGGTPADCTASFSLAEGASCNLSLEFAPTVPANGATPGTVTLTDNSLNASPSAAQAITLSGTAISAAANTVTTLAQTAPATGNATYGQSVTVTATVAAQSGTATPTGSVVFKVDGAAQPSAALNSSGAVSITLTSLTAGAHSITATYTPTGAFQASMTATPLAVTLNQARPTIAWAKPASITYGTLLGATQLDATATGVGGAALPGTFTYSPAAGTLLTPMGAGVIQSLGVVFTPTDAADYTTASDAVGITVNQATLTATASNATRVYGAANPTFTGTVAGQQNGDKFTETFSTTATTSSTVGTYAIVPSVAGTNLADYTVAATNGTLSVTQATPSIALITSAASVLDQNPVTFTATVGSTVSAPTGTVAFLDGTTMLGSGTLAGGAASFTTTSLAVGTHTITAVYSGDTNFAAATSAAVSQAVQDFNLNISTSAGSTTSVTVVPGGTATYALIISPTGSTTFPAAVALSVSGLPTGATYTLTPSSIAAGAGTTNVTLTIQVPKTTAMLQQSQPFGKGLVPIALGLLLLPFSRRMRRSARKLGRTASLLLLLLVGAGAMAAVTGCGANTGYFGQAQQSYTVSVTGTSGALVHSTTVTLTVQ